MVNTRMLDLAIKCALISPYINNEKPLSLMIVAKGESGKTTSMKKFKDMHGVAYMTDCTAYGISRDYLPKLVSGEVRTLMIADLMTPLSKGQKTRASLVAFLNNLIEEGVAKITTYATVWDKEVSANVITAITDRAINDGRHDWASLAFLSRFVLFSYSYGINSVTRIFESYFSHGPNPIQITFNLPEKDLDINLPYAIAKQAGPIAEEIGQRQRLYGFRAMINFRSLLKSLAALDGESTVGPKQFLQFLGMAEYMNLHYNPLR